MLLCYVKADPLGIELATCKYTFIKNRVREQYDCYQTVTVTMGSTVPPRLVPGGGRQFLLCLKQVQLSRRDSHRLKIRLILGYVNR